MYRRGGSKKDNTKPAKEQSDSSKYAELLVFGYACKLYRDDERAVYHEQRKHLIPWMGDKTIMIDRYDGRGHLHDLSDYDAGSWNCDYKLSEEEARIEALCDEERYLAMNTDLLEEEARQEEEYKRLSEALADEGTYNAVAFRYSADYYDPSQPTEEDEANKGTDQESQEEEIEEPFVAPPGLVIPSDVELPATTKTHAIIERTANFVFKQGAQLEIVLKAKQARNSQFDFLRFDHYLNPYYKHILKAMKEGRYTPASESKQDQKQQDSKSDDSDYDDDGDGNYLHPSLFASKKSSRLEEIIKPLQVIDPDHPLAVLVRKAQQERNGAAVMATKTEEEHQPSTIATQAEYTSDPNVAAMYYGYCMLPDGTYCLAPPPPGIDASVYYTSMSTSTMPTPSVSSPPPPPGTVPFLDPAAAIPSAPATGPVTVTAPASLYHSTPADPPTSSSQPQQTTSAPPSTAATPVAAIIPPPPDIQPVIDKLAEYVARNGVKFETSVRAKNDPRFDFLQSWHQYNSYYEFKKHYFMQKEGLSGQEGSVVSSGGGDNASDSSSDKQLNDGKLIKASFAPICFAIKSKETDMLPLEKNRVRLDDDSDEDGIKGEIQEGVEVMMGLVDAARVLPQPVFEEKKPTLSQEELDAKQAKQKLEDRLSAAAREKLAQASKESKERQLQAERKRKAALFLQTLRGPEAESKRPDVTPPEPLVSALPRSTQKATRKPRFDYQETTQKRSMDGKASHLTTSSSSSRGPDRDRERDKKKKKHKRRSRSRSRSRSCSRSKSTTKHSLPSAYRSYRRSRSQSRSPSRRDRRAHSSERKREEKKEKESYGSSAYRLGSNPRRRRSRSRSPHDKRKKSSKSSHRLKGSSCSPSASPDRGGAMIRVSASPSPAASPTSSLGRSRDGSQEKDKPVPPTIVSAVQTRITQDLMAKVRAMLAASKGLEPNSS